MGIRTKRNRVVRNKELVMHRCAAFLGVSVLVLLGSLGAAESPQAKGGDKMKINIETREFGKTADGTTVHECVMTNEHGVRAKVITYGGIVTELHTPDRQGKLADVVLGFDNLDAYLAGHPFFGAITGRVANRIAKGKFTLDGKEYPLF